MQITFLTRTTICLHPFSAQCKIRLICNKQKLKKQTIKWKQKMLLDLWYGQNFRYYKCKMKFNTHKTMKHYYSVFICILLHFFSEQRTGVTDQTCLYGGLFAGGAFIVVITFVGIAFMMKRRITSMYKK